MKSKVLTAVLAVLLVASVVLNLVLLSGEELEPVREPPAAEAAEVEEYIYIAVFKNDPIILEQDLKGLEAFGQQMGVKVTLEGPDNYDILEMVRLVEEAIVKKPAGLMICGSEKKLEPYVNMAVEAGIPTITVDADLPDSERMAHVGSNWYDIGVKQAEALVKLVGGKGMLAMFGIYGAANTEDATEGFLSVTDNYEDIIVLDLSDDVSNPKEAQRLMDGVLETYPTIAGVVGFDSNSAEGICASLRAAGRLGEVKVVSVDMTSTHMDLLHEGAVQQLVGQRRELFTFYGGMLLYHYNHNQLPILNSEGNKLIPNIPTYVDTGLVVINNDGVVK